MTRIVLSAACAVLFLSGAARAGDSWEFWPELNLYKRLGPMTRLYFVAAYATGGGRKRSSGRWMWPGTST